MLYFLSQNKLSAGCLFLLLAASSSAFQPVPIQSIRHNDVLSSSAAAAITSQHQQHLSRSFQTILSSSASPEEQPEGSTSSVDDEPTSEPMMEAQPPLEEGESLEESPEGPPVDPEIQALKDEIDVLESQLKDKRRALAGTNDKADEYTKTGYARKVAEMENMRRARSMLASSNKQGAVASILTGFLPVFDRLQELNQANADDDFGKQYGALYGSMQQAFADMGVKDYDVNVGDEVDSRMTVLESVHSESQPANAVLECVAGGMELQGNIVRPAEVVASLGPEVVEEKEEGEVAPTEGEEDPEEGQA